MEFHTIAATRTWITALAVDFGLVNTMDDAFLKPTQSPAKRIGGACAFRSAALSADRPTLYNMYNTRHELMAMTVVPIRLRRQDARKLDLLVKLGLYNSRTEAMRSMIQATADEQLNHYMLNDQVKEALSELLQTEKRDGKNPLRITSDKTAAEIVGESRR